MNIFSIKYLIEHLLVSLRIHLYSKYIHTKYDWDLMLITECLNRNLEGAPCKSNLFSLMYVSYNIEQN